MFPAFPHSYPTIFTPYYIPFTLLLLPLIPPPLPFQFTPKLHNPSSIKTSDSLIFFPTLLPPFLLPLLFTTILPRIPIHQTINIYPAFTHFLNLYSLIPPLPLTLLSLLHPFIFLTLRTDRDLTNPP
ncbi:cytochrome d ubiquinol oxidase subunit II, partial [Bacillus altitudinis]|uniref:cytochrome d ubiquinol oxidase subunit II n=1 Tax=Bacillus altitudinis TaxID=293387 RepID=UPI003B529141